MATQDRLILDYVFEHAEKTPDRIYLTQPVGGGQVVNYSWAQVVDQSRRMAAHLRSRGFEPGARVAMLSDGPSFPRRWSFSTRPMSGPTQRSQNVPDARGNTLSPCALAGFHPGLIWESMTVNVRHGKA